MKTQITSWKSVFFSSAKSFGETLMSALPQILGALLLLLIGWLVAKSFSYIIARLLRSIHFDKLAEKPPLAEYLSRANIEAKLSEMARKLVYWAIFLTFVVTATETLGWEVVSLEISKLVAYLPRLFAAVVIFIIGAYIISFVRDFIKATTSSLGIGIGKIISNAVFYLLLIILMLTSFKQAGVDTSIITTNLSLIIGAVLLSAAIAYGFASKDILANILAAFYSKRMVEVGQTIKANNVEGKVLAITSVSVKIKTSEGIVVLPTHQIINNQITILD